MVGINLYDYPMRFIFIRHGIASLIPIAIIISLRKPQSCVLLVVVGIFVSMVLFNGNLNNELFGLEVLFV